MTMHACPDCGKLTPGSSTADDRSWLLCNACLMAHLENEHWRDPVEERASQLEYEYEQGR